MAISEIRNEQRGDMTCRSCRGVATVGLGMTGKVGPGCGVKTSRLTVSCVTLLRPVECRYWLCNSGIGRPS